MDKYLNVFCKYCSKEAILNFAEILVCSKCSKSIHTTCLKRQSVPGGITGDTFFSLICQDCSETGNEVFTREKITWFQVIILVMYHLEHKTPGTANRGFYHWRIHLVTFIDKKWNVIFPPDFKRKKNWMGTISGSLSHFSPCFFTSGTKFVGTHGWWRLTFPNLSPTASIIIYNELSACKQISLKTENDLVHIHRLIKKHVPSLNLDNFNCSVNAKNSLDDFMEEIDVEIDDQEISANKLIDSPNPVLHHNININEALDEIGSSFANKKPVKKKDLTEKTLFRKSANSGFYKFWKNTGKFKQRTVAKPLRVIEEDCLCRFILVKDLYNRFECALKRKLLLRSLKRKLKLNYLNVDEVEKTINVHEHYYTTITRNIVQPNVFPKNISCVRLLNEYYISPYTNRLLKPYIRRDYKPNSLWLRLMAELRHRVSIKQNIYIESQIAPLDYCYVCPDHVPVVNSLCEQFFWPGIDMSDALEYPEFSCVVLYKKLVVAFGFMVPDIQFNESYISFILTRPEWRGCGIATFIIYHLIQTCMGKDITLHVAVDNPALFLYQKFGFKVEEVIFNFYDAYLRDDSNKCKHAFFLRLER